MKVEVPAGSYILAVSGGVDSMVLLHLLAKQPGLVLIVAHFNHGIRADSAADEQLVAKRARSLGLVYETGNGKLGANASEALARQARYGFLQSIQAKHRAAAIITAHHQDDLIETAFINLLRGSGYKGLVAMAANQKIIRPLLGVSKAEIKQYAAHHKIAWREDPSNREDKYLRNYLRQNVMCRLKPADRQQLLINIDKVAITSLKLDTQIANLSQLISPNNQINRYLLSMLPTELANELITYWLRAAKADGFDRIMIGRLNAAIRTGKANTSFAVSSKLSLNIGLKSARFSTTV